MKKKKLLTIEDLVNFCKQTKTYNFSAKDEGYQICVHAPATFETERTDDLTLYAKVKAFHLGINRNGSNVTDESAKKAMKNMAYKPILANFCEIEGVKDFTSHDIEFDEDGNPTYVERQVGCFTVDEPYLEYDKEKDKTYVYATCAIPREYTDAAEIIERKNGTKVSVELAINSYSYNAEDKCLNLDDFEVAGCTLLGKDPETGENVEEGMYGARLDIKDFSMEQNSVQFSENSKLIEVLDKLGNVLSNFNNTSKNSEEGGKLVNKLEELLKKYSVTKEDLAFETENLSDEELEAKFAEVYGKDDDTEGKDNKNDEGAETGTKKVKTKTDKNSVKYTVEKAGEVKEFEISLDEQISALQNLVNSAYSDSDNAYYCVKVYSDNVVMIDYWSGRAFRQSYSAEEGNYTLTGDRVEVYATYVTKEEQAALDDMKKSFEQVKADLDKYVNADQKAQRDAILADEAYAEFVETEEFKNLATEAEKYSVEELRDKCDLAFAKLVKAKGVKNYADTRTTMATHSRVPLSQGDKAKEKKPYGDLFD